MKKTTFTSYALTLLRRLLVLAALLLPSLHTYADTPDEVYLEHLYDGVWHTTVQLTKNGNSFSGIFQFTSNEWGYSLRVKTKSQGEENIYYFEGVQDNEAIDCSKTYNLTTGGQKLLLPKNDLNSYLITVNFSQNPPTAVFSQHVSTTTSYTTNGGSSYTEITNNTLMLDSDANNDIQFGYKVVGSNEIKYGPATATTFSSNGTYTFSESNYFLTLPAGFYTYTITANDLEAPTTVTVTRSAKIIYPKTKYIVVNNNESVYADGAYNFNAGDVISFKGDMSDNSGKLTWGLSSDQTLAADTYTLTKGQSGHFTAPSDADEYVYNFAMTYSEGEHNTWTLSVSRHENTDFLSKTLPRGIKNAGTYKPQNPLTIWFTSEYSNDSKADASSPSSRSFLLGNGRIGLTTSGSRSEKILINDKTQYDGVLDTEYTLESTDNNSYNSLGYVHSFQINEPSGSTISQLDLTNGIATAVSTHSGFQVAREYLVSRKYDVAVVHYTSDTEHGLNYEFSGLDYHCSNTLSGCSGDYFSACYHVGSPGILNSNLTFRVLQKGGSISTSSDKISVTGANEIFLIISCGTDYSMERGIANSFTTGETSEQLAQRIKSRIDAAYNVLNNNGWRTIYDDHVAVTTAAMNASTFTLDGISNDIPSDVLHSKYDDAVGSTSVTASKYTRLIDMIMYQMGRYLSYCSSENEYNIASANSGLPFYLQGIWSNEKAAWRGDYHTNINFEMNYWPTEVTNLSSNIDNLTTYVTTMAATRWPNYAKKKKAGARGWVGDLGANNFGDLYHYWKDNEYVESNAWICESLWQHYLYTMDINYLQRIFPTLLEAAKFYLDYNTTVYGSTQILIPQHYSPEQAGSTYAAHAHQLVANLIDNVVNAYSILGNPSAYSSDISLLSALRSNMWDGLKIGSNNALVEWKDQSEQGVSGHRHLSHLVCLYPLAMVSPMTSGSDLDLWNAAYKALTLRSDDTEENALWNRAWKMACYARALEGDLALRHYALAFDKTTLSDFRSICANRAFQIDGNCGIPAGIAEMLLQSYNSDITGENPYAFITVAPALPSAWPAGEAKGLKAIGNFTVDLKWKDNVVTEAKITYNGNGNLPFFVQFPGLNSSNYYVSSISGTKKNDTETDVVCANAKFNGSKVWSFANCSHGATVTITRGAGEDAVDKSGVVVTFANVQDGTAWTGVYDGNTETAGIEDAWISNATFTATGCSINDNKLTANNATVNCHPGYKFVSAIFDQAVTVGNTDVAANASANINATSFTLTGSNISKIIFKLAVDESYAASNPNGFTTYLGSTPENAPTNYLYQDTNDNWYATKVALSDAGNYTLDKNVTADAFTYTRELLDDASTNGYWQPLFLPVALAKSEWQQFADKVIQFSSVEMVNDVETMIYTEVDGDLSANTMYIFMPNADISIDLGSTLVNAVPKTAVTQSSTCNGHTYTLTGNYNKMTGGFQQGTNNYALWKGNFMIATDEKVFLLPFRLWLSVTGGSSNAPQMVPMIVVDPDATGIEDILDEEPAATDDAYYDLTGRRVLHPTTGIYIHQGKKIYIK